MLSPINLTCHNNRVKYSKLNYNKPPQAERVNALPCATKQSISEYQNPSFTESSFST